MHHYAGPEDPLSTAMRNEALAEGIRLKTISVEKESGTGDLMADEPYTTHLRWARRGYIDAYHAGFPCSTFSRLRFRKSPNMPGPVRTKDEPYGKKANTAEQQASCDSATIMACRAIDMATAVCKRPQLTKVPPVSTLENPPPSDVDGHLSAWELGEMDSFRETEPHNVVTFNTCGYESHIKVGERHYKPQMFAGSLHGLRSLHRECQCGKPSNHDFITGPQKSKASATYPKELCVEYAKLAIAQLKLMGKEEFLKSRMTSLQDTIDASKAKIFHRLDVFGPAAEEDRQGQPKSKPRPKPRSPRDFPSMSPPTRREYKAATMGDPSSPARAKDPKGRTPLSRKRKRRSPTMRRSPKKAKEIVLKPASDLRK